MIEFVFVFLDLGGVVCFTLGFGVFWLRLFVGLVVCYFCVSLLLFVCMRYVVGVMVALLCLI